MSSAEDIFRKFLRQHRLKHTLERVTILRLIQRFAGPFEAEALLRALREADVPISKATVYRTLKHLVEAQLIKEVHLGAGKPTQFDFIYGELGGLMHDHLLDLDTGKLIPFSNEKVIKMRDKIAKTMGYDAISHRFEITARRLKPKN